MALAEKAKTSGDGAPVSKYITNPSEIADVLRLFRDEGSVLQIRLDNHPEAMTAKILDVGDDWFLLDDLKPRTSRPKFKVRSVFSLAGRAQGIYIYLAQNAIDKIDSERNLPYFQVRALSSMLYQQKRHFDRYSMPRRVNAIGARITLDVDGQLIGEIEDLSAGGCRAAFAVQVDKPLLENDRFERCYFSIPKLLDLTATAVIRHVKLDAERQQVSCGIEFTEMSVTNRRRLEQYVQSLARVSAPG